MLKTSISVLCAALVLSACAPTQARFTQDDVTMLASEIKQLAPDVDPVEAQQAATIAYNYSLQLREQYNVTDPPLIHNVKVNQGWRERGICVHWAEDVEARLNQEEFQTLQVHRAISQGNEFRIEHSTSIISARGETLQEGIVLDPWRQSGLLFWSPTLADERYYWEPRAVVLQRKAEEKLSALSDD